MADFLTTIAARSLGHHTGPVPRQASRFEQVQLADAVDEIDGQAVEPLVVENDVHGHSDQGAYLMSEPTAGNGAMADHVTLAPADDPLQASTSDHERRLLAEETLEKDPVMGDWAEDPPDGPELQPPSTRHGPLQGQHPEAQGRIHRGQIEPADAPSDMAERQSDEPAFRSTTMENLTVDQPGSHEPDAPSADAAAAERSAARPSVTGHAVTFQPVDTAQPEPDLGAFTEPKPAHRITVSIGRIEVRAAPVPPVQPARAQAHPQPAHMSLGDYLARTRKGRR